MPISNGFLNPSYNARMKEGPALPVGASVGASRDPQRLHRLYLELVIFLETH